MIARPVAMNPFVDVLAHAWDAISLAKDKQETLLWLLTGATYLHELFRRRRPKKHRGAAQRVRAHITFGAPTATARVSISPPAWL